MDIIAAALNMDPVELRKQNGYNEGDKFVTEETLRAVGLKECIDEVAKSIGWDSNRFKGSKVQEPALSPSKGSTGQYSARQRVRLHDQGDDHAVDFMRGGETERGCEPIHI